MLSTYCVQSFASTMLGRRQHSSREGQRGSMPPPPDARSGRRVTRVARAAFEFEQRLSVGDCGMRLVRRRAC